MLINLVLWVFLSEILAFHGLLLTFSFSDTLLPILLIFRTFQISLIFQIFNHTQALTANSEPVKLPQTIPLDFYLIPPQTLAQ